MKVIFFVTAALRRWFINKPFEFTKIRGQQSEQSTTFRVRSPSEYFTSHLRRKPLVGATNFRRTNGFFTVVKSGFLSPATTTRWRRSIHFALISRKSRRDDDGDSTGRRVLYQSPRLLSGLLSFEGRLETLIMIDSRARRERGRLRNVMDFPLATIRMVFFLSTSGPNSRGIGANREFFEAQREMSLYQNEQSLAINRSSTGRESIPKIAHF